MTQPTSLKTTAPLDLALAMVAASSTPLLLLDGDLAIVAVSESFCRAFAVQSKSAVGVPLGVLGAGEWGSRPLAALLASALAGVDFEDYELELRRAGRETLCVALNARLLNYDHAAPRLLVAVIDITEQRASQRKMTELVNDKAVLLQELQHRVANSLQIIASVLMQSARRVSSEEARGHLENAHHRVMSIAAVQRQLAESDKREVSVRPYFERLCASLSASMISDPAQLSITVRSGDATIDADASVAMGLVVTELVINALKHGYPDGRSGSIIVEYRASASDWVLRVSDDGVGMPEGEGAAKAGLGTSIVHALAKQLRAVLSVEAAQPGTRVSLVHHVNVAANDGVELMAAV